MTTCSISDIQDQYHFPFGSLIADGVDYLGLLCPHHKDAKNTREKVARVLARTLSLGVFPFALGLDMVYLTSASIVENMLYALAKTPEQFAERHKIAQNCSEARNKCLKGLLAFPQNLFGADMITMHFQTPGHSDIIRPYGKLYKSNAQRVVPNSVEEIIETIKHAKDQNRKISIKGVGYAQGKQTLPPNDCDICIDLDRFKKIEIDPKSKQATVGAGVRWRDLQEKADKHGLAILVQQASNVFSIGGSVGGANCHGWDHRWGSVGNTILSMQVVKPSGEVVTIKPGGIFFLRDHNANTQERKAIADIAHRFFNALSNVSDKDEEAEIRNFQALSYFIQMAQEVGFKVASEPLIREGDSSQNALIKFYKPCEGESQAHIGFIREKMINACHKRPSIKTYFRDIKQTHLTKVEWLNVEQEMAQAAFYKKNFFINYPHDGDAKESLSLFKQSFAAARKVASFKDVLFSDYTLMNSTISIATGVQNIAKSVLYTPCAWLSKLGRFLPHQNNPKWEKPSEYYGEWLEKYSNSLEIIPSYEHPFYENLKGYFKVLNESFVKSREQQSLPSLLVDRQTIKNITTTVAISADLLWRQIFALGVKAFYGGQENADAREIGLIINAKGKEDALEDCGNKVKVIVEEEKNPYKGIIVPRYKELTEVLEILSKHDVDIVEIAGQTALEIEFVVDSNGNLPVMEGVQELYRRHNYFSDQKKIAACIVPVDKLQNVLKEHRGIIHRIYDF